MKIFGGSHLYNEINDLETIIESSYKDGRVLVVTGSSIYKAHISIFASIEKKFNADVILSSGEILTLDELKKCHNMIYGTKPDVIIAIGGGRVMDIAKLLANPHTVEVLGVSKDTQYAEIISVPTTAGSGSEITPFAVLYIDGKKISIDAPSLKPKYTILDPYFLSTTPKNIAAAASFDAVCQSIEAILSKQSTDESDKIAYNSLQLAWDNQVTSFVSMESLERLSFAAYESGRAISITRTTLPHALSYYLTVTYGVKHGHAVALSMSRYLQAVYRKAAGDHQDQTWFDKINKIFFVLGVNVDNIVDVWEGRMKIVGLSSRLSEAVGKNIVNEILNNINTQRMENSPYKFDRNECANFFA